MIVSNRLLCPDGTIIESRHRHDYVCHQQDDGRSYFIDGGLDYVRCGGSDDEYTILCCTSDDPHCEIREVFKWGSYGKEGTSPRREILLKDIDDDHLSNIINHLHRRLEIMVETGYYETSDLETVLEIMHDEKYYRENLILEKEAVQ